MLFFAMTNYHRWFKEIVWNTQNIDRDYMKFVFTVSTGHPDCHKRDCYIRNTQYIKICSDSLCSTKHGKCITNFSN